MNRDGLMVQQHKHQSLRQMTINEQLSNKAAQQPRKQAGKSKISKTINP